MTRPRRPRPRAAWITDAAIAHIRAEWAAGTTTREIGLALGVTKNMVVSQVHRMKLPPRPPPIGHGRPRGTLSTTANAVHKRALYAAGGNGNPLGRDRPPPAAKATLPPQASVDKPPAVARPPVVAPHRGRSEPCLWPVGVPGTRTFRYCDAPSEAGWPYCLFHKNVAYVPRRKIGEPGPAAQDLEA